MKNRLSNLKKCMVENRVVTHVDSPKEMPRATIFTVNGWIAADCSIDTVSVGENEAELHRRPDVEQVHKDKKHIHGFSVKMRLSDIVNDTITIVVNGDNKYVHHLSANSMLKLSMEEKFKKYNVLFPDDDAFKVMEMSKNLEIDNDSLSKTKWLPSIFEKRVDDSFFDGKTFNFLTDDIKSKHNISDNPHTASRAQDPLALALISKFSSGKILDCGSGFPLQNYSNVVNMEIQKYPNTDVLAVGEELPFKENVFDVVFSFSVLEHVKDPFKCASEIKRVLKPNGILYASVPFLSPIHAYPHHYYNMTNQGLSNLFDGLDLIISGVPISGHPVFAMSWIAQSWLLGLDSEERDAFSKLTMQEVATQAESLINQSFCTNVAESTLSEIACTNMILSRKI